MVKYLVGMIGARRGYDVAKILNRNALLDHLFVDTYFNSKGWLTKLPFLGEKIKKSFQKYDTFFTSDAVTPDLLSALIMRLYLKYSTKTKAYNFANKRLAKKLISYAAHIQPESFYGFDTSSLEFFEWAHKKGWHLVLEQCVAPRRSQIEMLNLFQQKYGIDIGKDIEHCKFQQSRERKEWEYAHVILAPSAYVKSELIKDGVSADKIHIVPFGYSNQFDKQEIEKSVKSKSENHTNQPVKILFAGNAGYRKGIVDLLSVASSLSNTNIEFNIAGHVEQAALELIEKYDKKNIKYLGKLSPADLAEQYKRSDIFFFPSYLEGSAMVILEAMSFGLPVVTTYQSGSLVEYGVNGFICEAGDVNCLLEGLGKLTANSLLRYEFSKQSLRLSKQFALESYEQSLLQVLTK